MADNPSMEFDHYGNKNLLRIFVPSLYSFGFSSAEFTRYSR